jgi:hypothetical protein
MTDTIDIKAYTKDCPVCAMPAGEPCPHTPIRCEHTFWYGVAPAGPWRSPPANLKDGETRICELCGLKQKATLSWEVTRAGYGSHDFEKDSR